MVSLLELMSWISLWPSGRGRLQCVCLLGNRRWLAVFEKNLKPDFQ